jgi:hypothetical protein
METLALLLGDRFWKLNRFHRYFVSLSRYKIVESKRKYFLRSYGEKSTAISPVFLESLPQNRTPKQKPIKIAFLSFYCTWFNPNHGSSRFQKLSLRKRRKTISEGESCPNMCLF